MDSIHNAAAGTAGVSRCGSGFRCRAGRGAGGASPQQSIFVCPGTAKVNVSSKDTILANGRIVCDFEAEETPWTSSVPDRRD